MSELSQIRADIRQDIERIATMAGEVAVLELQLEQSKDKLACTGTLPSPAKMGEVMKFERIGQHDFPVPSPATPGSAGYDLQARLDCGMQTAFIGQRIVIDTGFAVEIPRGFVGLICSRSGLAAKHGVIVLNAPGVIDSDYRGELKAILYNSGDVRYDIKHGDRIAQLVVVPCLAIPGIESDLDETLRGDGGLGSTGQ